MSPTKFTAFFFKLSHSDFFGHWTTDSAIVFMLASVEAVLSLPFFCKSYTVLDFNGVKNENNLMSLRKGWSNIFQLALSEFNIYLLQVGKSMSIINMF